MRAGCGDFHQNLKPLVCSSREERSTGMWNTGNWMCLSQVFQQHVAFSQKSDLRHNKPSCLQVLNRLQQLHFQYLCVSV